MKKAILTVSFGTSYEESRKKTIDNIEKEIAERYTQFQVYRAWTSTRIRRKIEKRDGIVIPDVQTAMQQIKRDGNEVVVVQPLYVINGMEYERMTEDVKAFEGEIRKIVVADPLLTTQKDGEQTALAIIEELQPASDEIFLLIGHGTVHYANFVYAAMDYIFTEKGYSNICMGTVDAYPDQEAVLKKIKKSPSKRLFLVPFMLVAGEHANKNLAGNEKDSWKNRFADEGYEVSCILKSLGEYPKIQKIFLQHTEEAIQRL